MALVFLSTPSLRDEMTVMPAEAEGRVGGPEVATL